MNNEIEQQTKYWNSEVSTFDSIYSHKKGFLGNFVDRMFRWDMYGRFEYTMQHSEPISGKRILDVGCGTGRFIMEYAKRGAASMTGLDIAENMIGVCKQRAVEENVETRCVFVHTDLLAYSVEKKYDLAIGIGLFDYIQDALPVIRKMRESVTDRAIMSFPQKWSWRAFVRKIRLSLRNCDVYFFTEAQIAGLLRDAGFARWEMQKIGQLYCVTAFLE